jgi:hypothetical protein
MMPVYFARIGTDGPIKIGCTVYLPGRLAQHQREWRYKGPLTVIGVMLISAQTRILDRAKIDVRFKFNLEDETRPCRFAGESSRGPPDDLAVLEAGTVGLDTGEGETQQPDDLPIVGEPCGACGRGSKMHPVRLDQPGQGATDRLVLDAGLAHRRRPSTSDG